MAGQTRAETNPHTSVDRTGGVGGVRACTLAVNHSHGVSHDEDHCTCQVCHVGHAAISQPTAQAQIKTPLLIERFAPAETSALPPEVSDILSVPRAPPA
jgi:hypothetical protein